MKKKYFVNLTTKGINSLHLKPAQAVALGFLLIILAGTVLLMLPIASNAGKSIGLLDALFTATSAVCITGLTVVTTSEHWSFFGHIVILVLVQIGGLGFMTFVTMIFLITKKHITIKERILIQESLNQHTIQGVVRLAKHVLLGTFFMELLGALALSFVFVKDYGLTKGIWYSIFHSVSAFCNSGIDLLGTESLSAYVGNPIINIVISLLIIMGGLGFTVWVDVVKTFRTAKEYKFSITQFFRHLSLHSKLVLSTTLTLILFGAVFFYISEAGNSATYGQMTYKEQLFASVFMSITPRTAGFFTFDITKMNYASKFMIVLLMFIGGSPAGTAGGIKTVTVSILIISVVSIIRGKRFIQAYNRNISFFALQRALAIFVISLCALLTVTMMLSFTETNGNPNLEFMDILFESVAALGTGGITLGMTPNLTFLGKILICVTMFLGRLGPITIAISLTRAHNNAKDYVNYPEERIVVG